MGGSYILIIKSRYDDIFKKPYVGERVQGHLAYLSQDKTQSLFYLYGDFDGWMIGPEPGQ